MGVSGTPRKLVLNGVSYDLRADADMNEFPQREKTLLTTTGNPVVQTTKADGRVENVKIAADATIRARIDALIDSDEPFPMSYTTADGRARKATGTITRGNRTTAENVIELTLLPTEGLWEDF